VRRAADSCCFRFRVVACKTPSPTGALAWEAGVLLNYEHLLFEQKVNGEERFFLLFPVQ